MCALQVAVSPKLGHSGVRSQSCFVSPSCTRSSERATVSLYPVKGLGALGRECYRGYAYSFRIQEGAGSNYSCVKTTGFEDFRPYLSKSRCSWRRQSIVRLLPGPRGGRQLPDGIQTSLVSKPNLFAKIGALAGAASFCDNSKSSDSHLQSEFSRDFSSLEVDRNERPMYTTNGMMVSLSSSLCLSALTCYSGPAYASENRALGPVYGDVGAVLEVGVQLIYLGALLVLLGVGSFLVVRQVLIKRELESAAKDLQDRVRSGEASSLEYFELGAVMLRKKFYQSARKHLNEAIKKWEGSEQDLAQVYNALGYSFFSDGKVELAVKEYEKAVKLQPTYVTAWNNLADAYETQKNYVKALDAYEEALQFDPNNKIATAKREQMKKRVERFQGIP